MDATFQVFGVAHWGALAAVALAAWLLARTARRSGFEATLRLRLALAGLAVAAWMAENVVAYLESWLDWQIGLPLQLCDVALVLGVASLVKLGQRWIEPLWFFAFAGTLPALLWPELQEGFPSFRFLIYFLPHGLVVAIAWMMVGGFGLIPQPGAWRRAFVALNLVALAVTPVNLVLDTNFFYLRAKPATASPFDWFGPWPLYLLVLEALAAALFFLLELPFAGPGQRAKRSDRTLPSGPARRAR